MTLLNLICALGTAASLFSAMLAYRNKLYYTSILLTTIGIAIFYIGMPNHL